MAAARAVAIAGALSGFGGSGCGSHLVTDVHESLQQPRNIGPWFLGRLFRESC